MDIDSLTVKQIKEISSLINGKNATLTDPHPYKIGDNYFIRTVTLYYLGRIKWVGDKEIVIEDASWIPDTGRFHEFVKGNLSNSSVEVEPILQDVILGRGGIIDATKWNSALPTEVK